VEQLDVEFSVEGNVTLRGWLFVPDGPAPRPAITMAHGYAGIREHGLDRFARVFADAGFVVLVHDHRGFGVSDGWPRFDIDPWRHIVDWRFAISYLQSQPGVDAGRIGLWGTSYAGGHALVLVRPTGGSKPWSPRCRRSAATSRACGGWPPVRCPPWRPVSATMTGECSPVMRQPLNLSSAPTPRRLRRMTRRTRWRFTPNRCPRGALPKPSRRALQSRRAYARTRAMGFAGVPDAAADDLRAQRHHHPHRHRPGRLRTSAAAQEARHDHRRSLPPVPGPVREVD